MERRHFVSALGSAVALAAATEAFAQDAPPAEHSHHDHPAAAGGGGSVSGKYKALADSSAHCVMTGEACLTHCLNTFATGDTSLAGCAKQVRQLASVCRAMQDIALSESSHVAILSKAVLAICTDCEAECRKHAAHHAECKACADACVACADECRKISA